MSRFSPTQKGSSRPGGLGGLAAALQEGVAGFQGQRDRQEQQRTREFGQDLQRGQALRQGITVDTPPQPEGFGSAFARALSGAPEPQPKAVVPGGFVVEQGQFEPVDPRTGQPRLQPMQSGNVTYDPNMELQREMAGATAKGNLGLTLAQKGRQQRQGELTTALGSVEGAPAGAAASESAAADWLGRPPQERALRLGDPGYAEAMAEVAGARYDATGGGQNRPPTEVESKDYIFAGLMESAMPRLREFAPVVRPEVMTLIRMDPTGAATAALTVPERRFLRSARQFISAALRKESGAAIMDSEWRDAFDRFVDTGFDDPETRQDKAEAREVYLNLLRRTSSRARNYYDRTSGGQRNEPDEPDAPPPGPVNIMQFTKPRTP